MTIRRLGTPVDHLWLAQRMAKTMGVDLCSAYDAGDLSQQEWASMLTRCRGCAWTEGCSDFLHRATLPDAETQAETPHDCRNATRFDALRRSYPLAGAS